jgi:hypothetical protein
MEPILETIEEEITFLTDKEVFTRIWFEPKKVFTFINHFSYEKFFMPLMFLAGFSRTLDSAGSNSSFDNIDSVFGKLFTALVLGGALGWISYYIFAALISWTGKWIEGKGNSNKIVRITAYSLIPSFMGLIFFLINVLIFGKDVFINGYAISNNTIQTFTSIGLFILQLILSVWTLILFIIGLSIAQNFSIGRLF